jgi:hypothetical protein
MAGSRIHSEREGTNGNDLATTARYNLGNPSLGIDAHVQNKGKEPAPRPLKSYPGSKAAWMMSMPEIYPWKTE